MFTPQVEHPFCQTSQSFGIAEDNGSFGDPKNTVLFVPFYKILYAVKFTGSITSFYFDLMILAWE